MERKNKFGYGFNLTFAILLIVIGVLFLIPAAIFLIAGYYDVHAVLLGAMFLICAISFLITGIVKTAKIPKMNTETYPINYMINNNLLFNIGVTVVFVASMIIFYIWPISWIGAFINVVGLVVIPFTFISSVLLLVAKCKNRSFVARNVLTAVSSFLMVVPLFCMMGALISFLPFVIIALLLLFALETTFAIYLIIELSRNKTSSEQKKIIDFTEVDEIKELTTGE